MAQRIKSSLGSHFHNVGTRMAVNEEKYVVDRTREFYLFDVIPIGAPRMTQSDRWKVNPNHPDPRKRQRPPVTQYYAFKDALKLQANLMKFELPKYFEAVYFVPMPDSWSEKKKLRMNGMPCEPKPDTDNITKGIKDTLRKSDSDIWLEFAQKRWAYNGSILIYV